MTNFMTKRKFKFQVDFLLADLSDLPLVNAALFAKIRLLDGGSFQETTEACRVANHHVCWDKTFRFPCRISCDATTGVLEPCLCRVSIRKETKGGKSFDKLGYIDVNLSEFGGSGVDGSQRSYLLEGYSAQRQRQDNSRLRICVCMTLQSADPFFKVPKFDGRHSSSVALHQHRHTLSASISTNINPAECKAHEVDGEGEKKEARGNSGIMCDEPEEEEGQSAASPTVDTNDIVINHSRNSSTNNDAAANQRVIESLLTATNEHSDSRPSCHVVVTPVDPPSSSLLPTKDGQHNPSRSVSILLPLTTKVCSKTADSRVNASTLIDGLLEEELHDELLRATHDDSEPGLSLFVSADGSATISGSTNIVGDKMYTRVVVDNKTSPSSNS